MGAILREISLASHFMPDRFLCSFATVFKDDRFRPGILFPHGPQPKLRFHEEVEVTYFDKDIAEAATEDGKDAIPST